MTAEIQKKFDPIAKQVLSRYELDQPAITFIRHSDNVTYQVTTANSEKFLLRLHVPITSSMGSHGANAEMVHSEVTWLLALDQDTSVTVPTPMKNRSGSMLTCVPAEDGVTINSTLLRWIEGEPYFRDLETEQTAFQIGSILASLHNHASQWEIPAGFVRPKRDVESFRQVLRALVPAVEGGLIRSSDYQELARSTDILIGMINRLEETRSTYGILHSDAHKGNMVINEGKIFLIDFSFCAFGNYMFDMGICLSDMKPELHSFCLEGYQSVRALPENYPLLIEGYFIGSVIGTFSFWVSIPSCLEILVNKVPKIVDQFARKFNQNERFWFTS